MTGRLLAILERVPLVRNEVNRVRRHMQMYYPGDVEKSEKKAAMVCLRLWGICFLVGIYFICTDSFSFQEICLAVCSLIMAYRYVLYKMMEKEEQKLLQESSVFIGELSYQYSYSRRIEEALEECLDCTKGMMFLHGKWIWECLDDEEKEAVYIPRNPNRFLTLLYILCKTTFDYGDKEIEGKSLFLWNLDVIKNGIESELLKRQKITYRFSGLLVTCMIPLLFVKIIEMWSLSNMEELDYFYKGSYGMITTLLLCGITLLCYFAVQKMQYEITTVYVKRRWLERLQNVHWIDKFLTGQINSNYKKSLKKHRVLKACGRLENVKQFLLLQYVTGIVTGVFLFVGLFNYQLVSKNQIIMKAENMLQDMYQVQAQEKKQISQMIEEAITGKKKLQKEELMEYSCPEELVPTVYDEIKNSRKQWATWEYDWYVFLFPFVAAVIAYHLRYGFVLVGRTYGVLKKQEEILVYQSIILFLKHMDAVESDAFVQWFEKTAFYFKKIISRISYELAYENYEELERLIETEEDVSMRMILEGIKACDSLQVREAFRQVDVDYEHGMEKYKQQCETYISDKSAIGKVLAFVPLYMTVGIKLIIPFVLEGISKLTIYGESMEKFL